MLTWTWKDFSLQYCLTIFVGGNIMGGEAEGVEYNETSGQTRAKESLPDPLDSQHDRAQCSNPSLP